jgi:hypothetical protein
VSLRAAPDTMSVLTAVLPVAQGVSVYKALLDAAASGRAAGGDRSRGQLMADTLVERVTGRARADRTPVEVQLVIGEESLLGHGDDPARLAGYGPVPAAWARELVRGSQAEVFVRRLFTRAGRLVGLESSRRLFPAGLRDLLVARDERCRTPWCGAPIRHADHVVPVDAGGQTSEANGQGLCEACNHTKQATSWRARPGPGGAGQSVTITTPTSHSYTSHPPPLPGHQRPPSVLEEHFRRLLEAA